MDAYFEELQALWSGQIPFESGGGEKANEAARDGAGEDQRVESQSTVCSW